MTDPIPRLAFDDIDPELRTLLEPTVDRLGYFGEMFQVLAHLPQGLQTFMQYTGAVRGTLPQNLNEVLALTVCSRCGGEYERIQHERLSLKSGLSKAWVGELTGALRPARSLLDETERALRDLAVAVVERDGRDVADEIGAVVAAIGPEKTVAALLQITRFQMISTMCKALSLTLPVPSIFDSAYEG